MNPDLFAVSPARALELARELPTPCFVYDLGVARSRLARLRAALPARVRVAYAVKSNPGAPLLRAFAQAGAWFDCASSGEVERVRAAGGERLLFAGPGKTAADLSAALDAGARLQLDGIEDVQRLAAWARARGVPELAVSLRVHPQSGVAEGSPIIGGAGPSAFGVDEERLEAFLEAAAAYPEVHIRGLQVFAASNELGAERLLDNHRAALRIARRLHALGHDLDLIDLGGGLGIPYADGEGELDVAALGEGLAALLRDNPWFTGELVLEPGRWLSGPCGVYLCRVVRVKESRGVRFAVLEGGINHLLRPLLTGQPFPVLAPGRAGEPTSHTLAGPLCTSLDRLGEVSLPPVQPGDLLVFGQVGAYGRSEAMTDFLSRPPAAEHWLPAAPEHGLSGVFEQRAVK